MIPGVEEVGKTTRSFFDALKDQPLSLALVVMNLVLMLYLFYYTSGILAQRAATTDQIVKWQAETDKLMASCVSGEIMKLVLDSLQQVIELNKSKDKETMLVPLPRPRPRFLEDVPAPELCQ